MYTPTSYSDRLTFFQKIRSLDYLLLFCIIILGIVSTFAMYSSERGVFSYHTESHIYRFVAFFLLFLMISFINIKILFKLTYFFYFFVLILLFGVDFFGIIASGSKRWINLFFINLQPSELMKIALIVFFSKILLQNSNAQC